MAQADPIDFSQRKVRRVASGDRLSDEIDAQQKSRALTVPAAHRLDSSEARDKLRRLLEWYHFERDRQAANRMEMALDHDFYDGLQWDAEDAQTLRDRGQMPLVFNELAPIIDWLIGTERRQRVDWKVLPRTEEDVEAADIKTKTMKYVSDVNQVNFARSRAFADAVKGGLGWIDDGVRDDPTKDPIYSGYEDWRNVLHDSASYDYDMDDARYIFRWRWVDEDVALMMFPDRADAIRQAVEDQQHWAFNRSDEDAWTDSQADTNAEGMAQRSGRLYAAGTGVSVDAKRRQVKLIECQYRIPVSVRFVDSGSMAGQLFDPRDRIMADIVARESARIVDRVAMRMHVAVFTPSHMMADGPSIFRHNKFSLTPVICYRRSRDRMPYGAIRRQRDVQLDLNKRASKALWLMNTNQVVAEEGAVDDWDSAREEVASADGLVVVKPGKRFDIRRDVDAATGQIQMMAMDAQAIQRSAGPSQENLGRQTNATSGEAIKARQMQGSVVTTEPFDNLRYAVYASGTKQLSLIEQFYTQEKVIRLTGARGGIEWAKINVPEVQADGSVRFLNDITATACDFVVAEQDFNGTLRAAMFDSLNSMSSRLPPEVGLRLLTIAMKFSDLPNRDEIADEIRQITGDRNPDKQPTPEEEAQAQAQAQQAAEAMAMQREQAMALLDEQRAKVREINARAEKLEAEARAAGMTAQGSGAMQAQDAAAGELERLGQELTKAQAEIARLKAGNDTALEIERIKAATAQTVAEIGAASDARLSGINKRLDEIQQQIQQPAQKSGK